MENRSPFQLAKDIQGLVQTRLSSVDIDMFTQAEREQLRHLQRSVSDLRLEIRDYSSAETKAKQLARGAAASKALTDLLQQLLAAGDLGIFGAADIAIVSATIDQLMAELKE